MVNLPLNLPCCLRGVGYIRRHNFRRGGKGGGFGIRVGSTKLFLVKLGTTAAIAQAERDMQIVRQFLKA